jgi:zinc protease
LKIIPVNLKDKTMMKQLMIIPCLLWSGAVLAAGPAKLPALKAKHAVAGNLTTEEYVMANGLTVFLTPNKKAPNVSVIHWVNAGSLHESAGISGIAHLFEHMMFRPLAPGEDDFSTKLRKLGGDYNANTRFESTVYTTTVPDQQLAAVLKHEADRFKRLKVTKELLDTERKAVWSEYSTKLDANPVFDLWYQVYKAGFPGHPFGWHIVGFREDLEKIIADDCNQFFSRYYRPNNTGLFIAGNIDVKATLAAVVSNYGDWQPGEASKMPPPFKHDDKYVQREGVLPSEAQNYLIGFRTPPLSARENPDLAIQRVVNHLFFGSDYSLAKRRFVHDKKIASEASDFNFDYDNGMLRLFLVMLPGATTDQVVSEVNALADDFARLSDDEFNSYLNEVRILTAEGLQRNKTINMEMALYWGKSGGPASLHDFVTGRTKISRSDVAAFVEKYFKKDNMVVVRSKQEKSSH